MIKKSEIINLSKQKGLAPHVIEKDYVLGWLLAGIAQSKDLRESWVFKGGTCIKKCYFDSYRMSEDLDFTLTDPSHINETFLKSSFAKIAQWIGQASGIVVDQERMEFELYTNPRGKTSCAGKIYYKGPIAPASPRQMPKIKLDLSADELLVEPPVGRKVEHLYADSQDLSYSVYSYSYVEIFAEKIRALVDRTRPRDLYDVVHFFRRNESTELIKDIKRVLQKKCEFKSISFPPLKEIEGQKVVCGAGWQDQLEHQLPKLPNFEAFWSELTPFFAWIESNGKIPLLPSICPEHEDKVIADIKTLKMPEPKSTILDRLQFSSVNRMCTEILFLQPDKLKKPYTIEPYVLRIADGSKPVLDCIEHETKERMTLPVDKILKANITAQDFVPSFKTCFMPNLISEI